MAVDIRGMSRKELLALQGKIEKALEKLAKADRKKALAAAEKAALQHGFSLSELGAPAPKAAGKKRGPKPGKKAAPKYANPADKSQTWTGRGRQPVWFKDAIASGKKESDLAI